MALLVGTAGGVSAPLPDSPFGPGPPPADKQSLLVVGDSVGASLTVSFPRGDFPEWSIADETTTGCGLAAQHLAFEDTIGAENPACTGQEARWRHAVEVTHPDAVVMSVGAWEVFDHFLRGRIVRYDTDTYRDYLLRRLKGARRVLTAGGAQLFIPAVPCYNQPSFALQNVDIAPIRNDPARAAVVNDALATFDDRYDDVTVIDDRPWLCPGGVEVAQFNGIQIRKDGVHYTLKGGGAFWRQVLMPAIEERVTGIEDTRARAYLVGDSVPLGLSNRFPAERYPDLLVADSTLLGCYAFPSPSILDGEVQPEPDGCAEWAASLPSAVGRFQPDVGVVFAGIGEQFDKVVDGQTLEFGTQEHDAWLAASMTERIDLFRDRDIPVVVVTSACHDVDTGNPGQTAVINDVERVDTNNAILADVVDSYSSGVTLFDLHELLCSSGFEPEIDGVTLYDDGLHFTDEGAAFVWNSLAPVLVAAGNPSKEPSSNTSPSTTEPPSPGSPQSPRRS